MFFTFLTLFSELYHCNSLLCNIFIAFLMIMSNMSDMFIPNIHYLSVHFPENHRLSLYLQFYSHCTLQLYNLKDHLQIATTTVEKISLRYKFLLSFLNTINNRSGTLRFIIYRPLPVVDCLVKMPFDLLWQ